MNKIIKYNLEFTVFVCGAVVMIFELIGSRIAGPYVGTSIYAWTSLIGVILASLSLGDYIVIGHPDVFFYCIEVDFDFSDTFRPGEFFLRNGFTLCGASSDKRFGSG